MQEKQVSVGGTTFPLEPPFFVLATQNPLESEGTYALPDAQLDRFLMKLLVKFPSEEEVMAIVTRTTGRFEQPVDKVATGEELLAAGRALRQIPVAEPVLRHAVQLVLGTHPESPLATAQVKKYVRCGASPRAAQALTLVGKFFAVLDHRLHVSVEDVHRAALPCLRHRILRGFDAVADGVTADALVIDLLKRLPPPGRR
jgi:MoxR-like ATPase